MTGTQHVVVLDRQRLRGDAVAAALRECGIAARVGADDGPVGLVVLHQGSVDLLGSVPGETAPAVVLLGPPAHDRRPVGTVAVLGAVTSFENIRRVVADALQGRAQTSMPEASPTAAVDRLSSRELSVLQQLALGRGNLDIGAELGISSNTVRTHVQNIFGKLGVSNRHAAVAVARRSGILDAGTDS